MTSPSPCLARCRFAFAARTRLISPRCSTAVSTGVLISHAPRTPMPRTRRRSSASRCPQCGRAPRRSGVTAGRTTRRPPNGEQFFDQQLERAEQLARDWLDSEEIEMSAAARAALKVIVHVAHQSSETAQQYMAAQARAHGWTGERALAVAGALAPDSVCDDHRIRLRGRARNADEKLGGFGAWARSRLQTRARVGPSCAPRDAFLSLSVDAVGLHEVALGVGVGTRARSRRTSRSGVFACSACTCRRLRTISVTATSHRTRRRRSRWSYRPLTSPPSSCA